MVAASSYGRALTDVAAGKDNHHWRVSPGSVSGRSAHSAHSCGTARRDPPIHLSTIGRREVLAWLNDSLDLSLTDLSQTQNGAVACQMLDRLHPGVLPIKKVDFNANQLYYHEANWRLLQLALQELSIDYNLDVAKCTHGHTMSVLQVFRFFMVRYENLKDDLGGLPPYDAPRVRAGSKTGDVKPANGGTPFSSRSNARRSPYYAKGGCVDEPEDLMDAKYKQCASELELSTEDSASSVTGSNWKRFRKGSKKVSVHFHGDKRASLWSRFMGKLHSKRAAEV